MKSVIQLVKTNQGYSIVDNGLELNRITVRETHEKIRSLPKKFQKSNLTIYPYLYTQEPENNQKYLILPSKAQWFTLTQVHEIEKKALPEWFRARKAVFGSIVNCYGIQKPDKFEKNEELYKKYRNHIIQLAKKSYVSATSARRGLAGDVCAIIRIHNFLQSWGLINYVYPKKALRNSPLLGSSPKNAVNLQLRKDCIEKDKSMCEKNYDKDHLLLLKKITKKMRPLCNFCDGICGIVWYQYHEKLFLREFNENNQFTNSQSPFNYQLIICADCLHSGSMPVFLEFTDFQKKSVNDQIRYRYQEPRDKKRTNEENKILETVEKNKLNIRKSAEMLKMSEKDLYAMLICVPLLKVEKMARIDQDTDAEAEQLMDHNVNKLQKNGMEQMDPETNEKKLDSNGLIDYVELLQAEQMEKYEQFIQSWLMKIMAKVGRLGQWQKSVQYYSDQILSSQKNKLADLLKSL